MNRAYRGFTLVEVLVVIVVVAILATIVSLGLNGYLAQGRDAQRSSSMVSVSEALEKYYDANGEYPGCTAMSASPSNVVKNTLTGVTEDLFVDPRDSGTTTSITCDDIESVSGNKYQYRGDGSETCATGQACLAYTLRYREEQSGTIKEIDSRRKVSISTSGIPDLAASGTGITRITTNWNMVPNSTGYHLQVSSNASFSSLVVDETYEAYSEVLTGLGYNTTYYLRIRAVSSTGSGNWSPTVTATTQALSAPTVSASTTGMTSLRATWGSVSSATGYTVQIARNTAFTTELQTFTASGTSQNFSGLDYNTAYYIRVRAVANSNNGPWSATVTRTTDDLDRPTLSASTSSLTSLSASWTAVPTATSYTLELSTVSSFSTITRTITATTTSTSITGLSYNTTYYLRVKGVWSGNQGPWSNVVTRSTDSLDAPTGLSATALSTSSISADWDASVGASSYRLEWSTSSSFSSLTGSAEGITSTARSATGLSSNTLYYFRVRAVWSGNSGPWSSVASARTDMANPTGTTITAAMSGSNAVGTASASCANGSPQYQIRYRSTNTSTMGTWSSWSSWTATTTRSVATAQGYQYGFQVQSRCISGSYISDTVSPTTVATTVRAFAAPGAPSVSASTSGGTTTFTRGGVTCSGNGTAEYRYRRSREGDYYSYSGATTGNSATTDTTSQGWNYGMNWQGRCKNIYNTGPFGSEGRATYLRPVGRPNGYSFNMWRESSSVIKGTVSNSCDTGATLYGYFDVWAPSNWPWVNPSTGTNEGRYGWRRDSYGWVGGLNYWANTITTGATTSRSGGIPSGTTWRVAGHYKCQNMTTGRNSGDFVYGESGAYGF
jgi:prepilin-type N-terminal cleavage/methylation domain-containing protein